MYISRTHSVHVIVIGQSSAISSQLSARSGVSAIAVEAIINNAG
jgi:hypothetical protein